MNALMPLLLLDTHASVAPRIVSLIETILQRLSPRQSPKLCAGLQLNLGAAYTVTPTGNRTSNLQKAIGCYQAALTVFTPRSDPYNYATIQNNLGESYRRLDVGNRSVNLETAIGCYREALRFRTSESVPLEYADTQYNLGLAYCALPQGNRATNMRQALACFREALRFHTFEQSPCDYSNIQAEIGNLFLSLQDEDRAVNLRQAISCFQEALRFRTPDISPLDYAWTQNNLGYAYAQLPDGDRAVNLRQAISCFQEALRFRTPDISPLDYAWTQNNLGAAYVQLSEGDRAANLRHAMICFQEALRFRTPEVGLQDYAETKANLGSVYLAISHDDEERNLRQAIDCFREALRFRTFEQGPAAYAETQEAIGNVFSKMYFGDRTANLLCAIECYREALRYLTPEVDPIHYAWVQSKLGSAYDRLPTGFQPDQLPKSFKTIGQNAIECYKEALRYCTPDSEVSLYNTLMHNLGAAYMSMDGQRTQAIICFREALEHCSPDKYPIDYAGTQHNLGIVYTQSSEGNRTENLLIAIECFREALRFRTPIVDALDYSKTQSAMGDAYSCLNAVERTTNEQMTIECYNEALRIQTPERFPVESHYTANQLGSFHFGRSEWHEAHEAFATAIRAGDLLYRSASTEFTRLAEHSQVWEVYLNDAYSLARLGRHMAAVECLEAGKARALARAFVDRIALEQAKTEDRIVFDAIRERIKALEQTADESMGKIYYHRLNEPNLTCVLADLEAARHELARITAHLRGYSSDFLQDTLDFQSISQSALSDCPFVYLITTSKGSLAIIVPPEVKTLDERHAVWLDQFNHTVWLSFFGIYWGGQVSGDVRRLKDGLDRGFVIVREKPMGPLADRIVELGYQKATLIPEDRLGLFPLQAVSSEDVIWGYSPSARTMQTARKTASARFDLNPVLLCIANPLPNPQPLRFAGVEAERIAQWFPSGTQHMLHGYEATRLAVVKSIPGSTHLHFACHSTVHPIEPLESYIALSGDDVLKLEDLLSDRFDFSSSQLAVLSACQTGFVHTTPASNEAIGFAAGLLQAGVPGVVSALWAVEDLSTAVLMERFYHEHVVNGLELATALHYAQVWLRTSTAMDMCLTDRYERLYLVSIETNRDAFLKMRYYRVNPEIKPFAHPYYWAAFTFSGVG